MRSVATQTVDCDRFVKAAAAQAGAEIGFSTAPATADKGKKTGTPVIVVK